LWFAGHGGCVENCWLCSVTMLLLCSTLAVDWLLLDGREGVLSDSLGGVVSDRWIGLQVHGLASIRRFGHGPGALVVEVKRQYDLATVLPMFRLIVTTATSNSLRTASTHVAQRRRDKLLRLYHVLFVNYALSPDHPSTSVSRSVPLLISLSCASSSKWATPLHQA
jgi:hypothetical protein